MSEHSSKLARSGGEEMGMTDAQFKSYQLEQLANWKRVLKIVKDTEKKDIRKEVQAEVEDQVEKLNAALQF